MDYFRFFTPLRMTKLCFVIGEFISGWLLVVAILLQPCGTRIMNEPMTSFTGEFFSKQSCAGITEGD